MTVFDLFAVFSSLPSVSGTDGSGARYTVARIPWCSEHLVARSQTGAPCILFRTSDAESDYRAPLAFRHVTVMFNQRCTLEIPAEGSSEGLYTVVASDAYESGEIRYFLALCESMLRLLGPEPGNREIEAAVERLAEVLAKARPVATRGVAGLFGEVFLMWRSPNPELAVECWRSDPASRFDFGADDWRLDMKTTSARARTHVFSYDQTNPPQGVSAFAASVFLEPLDQGTALGDLVESLMERLSSRPDLVGKLQMGLTETLGVSLERGLSCAFDLQLADESLAFFDALAVPAVRGELAAGVTDVHFQSDLTAVPQLESVEEAPTSLANLFHARL